MEHFHLNCTGMWRLVPSGKVGGPEKVVRCDTCGRKHDATPENRLKAIDENYAGIYLRRLTAEGRALYNL